MIEAKISKSSLLFFILLLAFNAISQEKKPDSLKVDIGFANRYLWRGQPWGGDYSVVQPTIAYDFAQRWAVELWATNNFRRKYFYPDGITPNKGYQEFDVTVRYAIAKYLTVEVSDYYWPSVQKVSGVDNHYFNYGKDGVKTVDLIWSLDYSEIDKNVPFEAVLSTLVAGNDFRYNSNGDAKQNFTTYLEVAYTFSKLIKGNSVLENLELKPTIGAVLNNQAEYYTSGDYDKVSFVNMGVELSEEFELCKHLIMPFSLNYIHNAASANTNLGKDFLVGTLTLQYR